MMRNALTVYTHERYIRARSFYPLISQGAIDNPDQRITQDIEKLSANMAEVLSELIIAPVLIAYYTVKCWSMSGFFGPLSVYLYFIFGALITRWVMPPIIRNVYLQEQEEGNFRFHEVRIREFAESIAFYGGEEKEKAVANESLDAVVRVQRRLLWKQFWLSLVTQMFSYLGASVSYVIIAIPIFVGVYDDKTGPDLSSIISMNAFVSMYLIYRFTVVIEQAKKLTDIAGFAARIVQLWEELDGLEALGADSDEGEQRPGDGSETGISAQDLAVCTPSGTPLVRGLTVDIEPGNSLIITGANGVGKTSVLRTLCGLWQPSSGNVRLPYSGGAPDVFFLPQMPYIVGGSLREQLSYPGSWGSELRVCRDRDLDDLLETVGLPRLIAKLSQAASSEQFWLKTLSPGEQQKISIARVLFWKPKFAVLDECTSSLDQAAEASLYQALVDNNITLISVSHRDALLRYHRRRLDLTTQGYTITDI
ncbi:hypothetical protein GQ54DRAFT_284341 [Martensiomyces pterosporus]|nr:hypothetical protein GQ54DRAFT_284341 [Martensiomyces pterosporus]